MSRAGPLLFGRHVNNSLQSSNVQIVLPRFMVGLGWSLIAALGTLPGLLIFGNVHSAPSVAVWITAPVAIFAVCGSVVWFPIAMVIVVRRFRAGYLPATREFVQLVVLGIVAASFLWLVLT